MIEIKNLRKVYSRTIALHPTTLHVPEGETFGLLGPNGSGKTTLISMLSTLLEPTSGTALVNGHDILAEPSLVKEDIGIVFQETSLDESLTGYENLELQAALYEVPRKLRERRIAEMLQLMGLAEWSAMPVSSYSGGMKRRLEIARALIHKPKILLLDEPTLGLDPKAREAVWRHIQKLKEMTIVIATNYIEEAERLCDRIGIIHRGRIIAVGSAESLKSSISLEFASLVPRDMEEALRLLESLGYVKEVSSEEGRMRFSFEAGARAKLLGALARLELESIEIRRPTLSDVFLSYTGSSIEVPMEREGGKRRRGMRRRGRAR